MDDIKNIFPVGIPSMSSFGNIMRAETNDDYSARLIKRYFESANQSLHNKVLNVILVGCGGTGGYVLAELLRIIGGAPDFVKRRIYLTAIDGDEFEPKNLGRQLCTQDDIGENKAVSLINTYGSYFGCNMDNIIAVPEYLTHPDQLIKYIHGVPSYKRGSSMSPEHTKNIENIPHPGKGYTLSDSDMYKTVELYNSAFMNTYTSNDVGISSVTTIILDCVDRNAPRKLIHDCLEAMWTKESIEEMLYHYCGTSYNSNSWCGIPIDHIDFRSNTNGCPNNTIDSCSGIYPPRIDTISYPKKGNTSKYYNNKEFDMGYVSSGSDYLTNSETYIISSGNGEHSGQVYWGRYSNIFDRCIPVRYEDIWKDGDSHSSVFGGVKNIDRSSRGYTLGTFDTLFDPNNCILKNFMEDMYDGEKYLYEYLLNNQEVERSVRRNVANTRLRIPIIMNSDIIPYKNSMFNSFEAFASYIVSVPSPYNRFPELIDLRRDEIEDSLSCAERAAQNVQNIYTNKTAAQIVINYFKTIFNGIFILDDRLPSSLTTVGTSFDIRSSKFSNETLTVDYLKTYDSINMLKYE